MQNSKMQTFLNIYTYTEKYENTNVLEYKSTKIQINTELQFKHMYKIYDKIRKYREKIQTENEKYKLWK